MKSLSVRNRAAQVGCLLILLAFNLIACADNQATRTLEPSVYPLAQDAVVVVEIESGALVLTNGEPDQVELISQLPIPAQAEIIVRAEAERLHISIDGQGQAPLSLRVPPGTTLRIETFDAELNAVDLSGDLRIDSTTGEILLQNCRGNFILATNRGDASVQASQGEITLFGNYGYLSLVDVSGDIKVGTIMGTIHFEGQIGVSDQVHLESDHGPIEVWLSSESDVSVNVTTTNGVVDCVIPGLEPAGAGCTGSLGNSQGALIVRTVSGDVDIQRIP